MKKFLFQIVILLTLWSCNRQKTEVVVAYTIQNASSEVMLEFYNELQEIQEHTLDMQSTEDKWEYEFVAFPGDIVHLNAVYFDTLCGIKASILLDGKIYKAKESYNDPGRNVVVAGVVPFDDE